jgi:gamma-glutamyltranspeptidase/glutathione hydrolase
VNRAARLRPAIADTWAESFYRGDLAERILADSREFGGYFYKEDFSNYRPEWVEPVSVPGL